MLGPAMHLVHARARLRELDRRGAALAASAAILGAFGVLAWLLVGRALGVSALVGGVTALGLAGLVRADRRRLLLALVAQGDVGTLPAVAAMTARVARPADRRRLADALRLAAEAGTTTRWASSPVDPERAERAGPRLRALASLIAETSRPAAPPALALARQLLADGARSPLYNPRIPESELERVLDAIQRGVTPSSQEGASVPESGSARWWEISMVNPPGAVK